MNIAQHLLVRMIGAYRWLVSPVLTALFSPGGLCRYSPSCSDYAQQAIQSHGVAAGAWLAARRVCRCHPWGGCGHDPVPEVISLKLHPPLDRGTKEPPDALLTPVLSLNRKAGCVTPCAPSGSLNVDCGAHGVTRPSTTLGSKEQTANKKLLGSFSHVLRPQVGGGGLFAHRFHSVAVSTTTRMRG